MPKKLDLTGKRYGQLTAICAAGRTTKAGSVIWKCRCDCENEVEVSASDLNKGNNRSCGCRKEKSKKLVRDRLHIVDGACVEWLDERKGRHDNRSGCPGVYRKRNGKYTVNIGFKKKIYYLGSFDNYEKAAECRRRAEKIWRIASDLRRRRHVQQHHAAGAFRQIWRRELCRAGIFLR